MLTESSPSLQLEDIEPDNVFVDCAENPDGTVRAQRVQIGDFEIGSIIPSGLDVRGARLGRQSNVAKPPESHAAARINLPSDIFPFGLVVSATEQFRVMIAGH